MKLNCLILKKTNLISRCEGISFYFSYLYADPLVYHVSLVLCLYSSVFSVIAAIAKQSQFHPGGSGYPVASCQPPLQIQRAEDESRFNYTEHSLPSLSPKCTFFHTCVARTMRSIPIVEKNFRQTTRVFNSRKVTRLIVSFHETSVEKKLQRASANCFVVSL